MKHGSSNRRQRNRGGQGGQGGHTRRGGGNQRTQIFDSNGPDVRIRGTAHQVSEKYKALAKDAASAGDRSLEENYLQHAEHYQRVINIWEADIRSRQDAAREKARDVSPAKDVEVIKSVEASSDGDLSLPASILGADSKVESSAMAETRTAELAE